MFSISLRRAPGTRRLAAILLAGIAAICIVSSGGITASAGSPNPAQPDATCATGGQCFADVPATNAFYAFINRLYQQDIITGYSCGGTNEPCDTQNRPYYRPGSDVTRQQMAKFVDQARHLPGISIDSAASLLPIYARTTSANSDAIQGISNGGDGVYGQTTSGYAGVTGYSNTSPGVRGDSIDGAGVVGGSVGSFGVSGESAMSRGVSGESGSGVGVYAQSSSGYGLFAESSSSDSLVARQFGDTRAGYFIGDVEVSGACCASAQGTFKIDHPLDPANKYLQSAAVASPDMVNIYSGNVTTDAKGEATVALPDYVEAANGDFRYQLTVVGQFAQAIVQSKIKSNHFTIKTDKPNVEVSWQVTGVRHDPYAQQHPITAEQAKPADQQGMYLYPELYNQPNSKMIGGEADVNP